MTNTNKSSQAIFHCAVMCVAMCAVSSNSLAQTPLLGNVAKIAAGSSQTCALSISGGVKCWGNNSGFAVGDPSTNTATPMDVPGLTAGVSAIAAGGNHSRAYRYAA